MRKDDDRDYIIAIIDERGLRSSAWKVLSEAQVPEELKERIYRSHRRQKILQFSLTVTVFLAAYPLLALLDRVTGAGPTSIFLTCAAILLAAALAGIVPAIGTEWSIFYAWYRRYRAGHIETHLDELLRKLGHRAEPRNNSGSSSGRLRSDAAAI